MSRSFSLALLLSVPMLLVSQTKTNIAYIKLDQFKVAGVTLGSPLKSALKAFGKPDSILRVSGEADSLQEYVYYFDRVTASIIDNKVSQLECSNPKYKTPQGITAGETYERLSQKLGKPKIWKAEGWTRATYVLWPPCDTYMTFELEEKHIVRIILEYVP